MILRDEQIDRAVVVVIARDDRSRLFKLNLVEPNIGGDVFESFWPKIAEQPPFPFTIFRLADRYEIDPSVIVVVKGGDAGGANPAGFGKIYSLKALSRIIFPKR